MGRRRGFTLLELTFAVAILAVVMGALINSLIGMRKSQGSAVSANLLKVAGQEAVHKMVDELRTSRKLLAEQAPGSTPPLAEQYLARFEGIDALTATERDYPAVDPDGAFGEVGAAGAAESGQLDPNTVGNMLVFVKPFKQVEMRTAGVTAERGSGPEALASTPYQLTLYRFIAYYLAAPSLPASAPSFYGGRRTTYQLARWESQPFVERTEFNSLLSRAGLMAAGAPTAGERLMSDLTSNQNVRGIWWAAAPSASHAFFAVDASGALVQIPAPTIPRYRRGWLISPNLLEGYATSLVSFNTSSNFWVGPSFQVPAYARPPAASPVPYGFEVAIAGPSGARQVLLRLSLAARLQMGLHLYGMSHQEVCRVFDM